MKNRNNLIFNDLADYCRPFVACTASNSRRVNAFFLSAKTSKQSALAVSQHLRDNQHQSTGMFRYALA
jgi:hypothetical protein